MLARIQQALTLSTMLLVSLLAWRLADAGHFGWAAVVAPLAFVVYPLVLATEFGLMWVVNRRAGIRVDARSWLRAWWGEVGAGLRVFGWRQPWRSRQYPDLPTGTAASTPGVVLVHGFFCNRGLWNPWLQRLSYEGVPWIAVDLEPVFGSIDAYVPTIEAAVQRMEQATGRAPVVVAHSMGGLAVRRWLVDTRSPSRVARVITLGSPHHGTWLARFAVSMNARQMRQGSTWLRGLAQKESGQARPPFTCFYSPLDNIVFPADTATLPGADNRRLAGAAHVDMVHHEEPLNALLRAVSRF